MKRNEILEGSDDLYETGAELHRIRNEMWDLLREAEQSLRRVRNQGMTFARAEAYWLSAIKTALGSDEYRTYSTTMLDTIRELTETPEEEDQD